MEIKREKIRYRFEDLEVWKIALEIIYETYRLVKKFPTEEKFALGDQMRRAATSIALNIAEGSGCASKKSFVLYLNRAKGSTLECVAIIKIALQELFLMESDAHNMQVLLEKEFFKVSALEKKMKD